MTRNRQASAAAAVQKVKKVVVHPQLHSHYRIQAVRLDSTLQEVVHAALCHEAGRLDLLPGGRGSQASSPA